MSLPLLSAKYVLDDILTTIQPHPTPLIALLILPLLTLYIHKDYQAFLSLGPGGTPSTPLGYTKLKILSLICLRDPLRPLPIPPHFRPQNGFLTRESISSRPGSRPEIWGIAPQRQKTQRAPSGIYEVLVREMRRLCGEKENCLLERTSCFEKHSTGLFALTPITRTCGGEVCHAHPSDGSLHMSLHPADVRTVLEKGWGERHPLARGGWCRRFVPREFVLVYAPRNEIEVAVVLEIIGAAVWWVSGIDVKKEGSGKMDREVGVEEFVGRQGCSLRF